MVLTRGQKEAAAAKEAAAHGSAAPPSSPQRQAAADRGQASNSEAEALPGPGRTSPSPPQSVTVSNASILSIRAQQARQEAELALTQMAELDAHRERLAATATARQAQAIQLEQLAAKSRLGSSTSSRSSQHVIRCDDGALQHTGTVGTSAVQGWLNQCVFPQEQSSAQMPGRAPPSQPGPVMTQAAHAGPLPEDEVLARNVPLAQGATPALGAQQERDAAPRYAYFDVGARHAALSLAQGATPALGAQQARDAAPCYAYFDVNARHAALPLAQGATPALGVQQARDAAPGPARQDVTSRHAWPLPAQGALPALGAPQACDAAPHFAPYDAGPSYAALTLAQGATPAPGALQARDAAPAPTSRDVSAPHAGPPPLQGAPPALGAPPARDTAHRLICDDAGAPRAGPLPAQGARDTPFYHNIRAQAQIGTHHATHHADSVTMNKNKDMDQGTQLAFHTLAAAIRDLKHDGSARRRVSDLELPTFDGRPGDWLAFRRIFDYTCASYTPIENLVRIHRAVRGPAREAIGTLILTAEDPREVLNALEARFARPELIVQEQIATLRALPRLTSGESANDLSRFACRVRTAVDTIRLLDQAEYLASPEIAHAILAKITPLLRTRWTDFAAAHVHTKSKLELLSEFLFKEAELHTKFGLVDIRTNASVHVTSVTNSRRTVLKQRPSLPSTSVNDKGKPCQQAPCQYCQATEHTIAECQEFSRLDIDGRWQWTQDAKVCRKCLRHGKGHSFRRCKKTCSVPGCRRRFRHHPLLHRETDVVATICEGEERTQSEAGTSGQEKQPQASTVAHARNSNGMAILKIIPVVISGPAGSVDTFALLDDGATTSFIDAGIATTVGATGPQATVEINCIGGLNSAMPTSFVDVFIKGRHSDQSHPLESVRAIPSLGLAEQTLSMADIRDCHHLSDVADLLTYKHGKPGILVGADNCHLTLPLEVRKGSKAQPVAILTALGWVCYGRTPDRDLRTAHYVNHVFLTKPDTEESLETLVRSNYSLDAVGVSKSVRASQEDQRAIDLLEATTRRLPEGRFETGLLWRDGIKPKDVPNSRALALSRFKSLEKKFTSESYAEEYKRNIKATIDKGYAERCSESVSPERIVWYLPHFGVVHPQKKKLRIVLDCAARCQGVSLNSMLLAGPDLLQPLLAILMRFREGAVALNADIREMYPQVKISAADRDAQRFFWREDPTQPIKTFRMSSMIFGAVSSPFTAIYLKNKNAEEHKSDYPLAAKAIVNDHYMDDLVTSVSSSEAAAQLAADIVQVHSRAGFEMRAWASNCPEALCKIPADLRAVTVADDGSYNPPAIRALGIWWELGSDSLQLVRSSQAGGRSPPLNANKRTILADLMAVYDPLGLLSPVVVKGKIIFQRTWRSSVGWDDELPSSLVKAWQTWRAELSSLVNIAIPRWYGPLDGRVSAQIHVFADASELAYACVAYWRFEYVDGSIKLALIGGKSRLAPLKPTTIPRLELQAALIAARFHTYIVEAHEHKPDSTVFWSDSSTVLHWLRGDARLYKPFVAHRVSEITEETDVRQWRYVPTRLNVADDATRPDTVFEPSCRWLVGPSFLLSPPEEWPTEPSARTEVPIPELRRAREQACPVSTRPDLPPSVVPDVMRFSSWTRLLRATAYMYKAAQCFRTIRSKTCTGAGKIEAADLNSAEQELFRHSQLQSFSQEYRCLLSKQPLPKNSRLRWALKLDQAGLIRLAGRTNAFTQSGSFTPTPIVLDGRHPVVRLYIGHLHEKAAHANTETVVNEARQKLFILGLRPAVKTVRNSCALCKLRKTDPIVPPTGDLPAERLAAGEKPFTHTGLDYFGPVSVAVGRRSEKRWVALFTCLTVRAIHLEIVSDLSADAAVMALRRFVNRRGCPATLWSDNGTAFVGAEKLLSKAADLRIKWRFIPPISPFMGGCWERLVRSVKVALAATLHERSPKEEVLATLLCEAEGLINSRPLTHVSVDPSDQGAITPNHFLLGTSSPYWPLDHADDSDLVRRVRWRKGLRLADHFWCRWVREYLPLLTPRVAGGTAVPTKEGDLVLLADTSLPRGSWLRGRVEKLYPGKDGVVRVVDVRVNGSVLRRPVRKLVRL